MLRYIYTLSFVFFSLIISAQESKNIIKGKLIDSLTTEPLAYASIRLESKSQENIIKGELADEKGSFSFVGIKDDKYVIRIEYVGYRTKFIEIAYEKINTQLDLGAISLSPISQLLESVSVSGIKPNVTTTIEKQVFRAEQFEVARGGTAIDVIKNIPSVMVNAEGEISVRGSKGFLILINGKPSQIDISTLLSQIPANTIEKIEMITAPSAKYDADGKAGIINVITKKENQEGWAVTANLQYGLPRIKQYKNATEPNRYGTDVSINYKKGKWDIASSFNYLKNDIAGRRVGDVNTTINNIYTTFPSEGERSYKRDNYGMRLSLIYSIAKSDELSGGVYLGEKNQFRTADIFYQNSKLDLVNNELLSQNSYFNANLVRKSGIFRVYNLDYIHRFQNSSTITISALSENANLDGFTRNRNLNFSNFQDTLQYTLNTGANPLRATRLKVDYEKLIGIGKFSAGYQYRNQQQDGNFAYFEKEGNGSPLLFNPLFSANINVLNKIHGIYSQFAGAYKKVEFSSGIRYENAYRKFIDNIQNEPIELKLSNFFPSANLLYNISDNSRFKIAYSRRVQRSTNNELNPYPEREHSETLERGDPHIRPEFIGIYEVGLTKELKKGSLYLNIYRQQIKDIVNRVNSIFNDTILNRVYTNAGKARLLGSEIGLTIAPVKKMKIFLGGNIYRLHIVGALFENSVKVNSSAWVYSINYNFTYQFNSTLSTQMNINYLSARNTAQGTDSRFYQPNLSIKKTWKDNRISLAIQWQNAALGSMKVNEQRITTFGNNFYTTTNYIQERNIVLMNIAYFFNKVDKKIKLPTSEFGEREF